jgi:uncharacterized protein YybS (DUF2232 family)
MQAGSVKTAPSAPLLQVGKATAMSVILGMCVAVLPFVPIFIVPFLCLPLAYVVARWGPAKGAIVAAVTGALVYFGAGADAAVLVFLLVAGMGGALGWAFRKGWRFDRSFALATGATAGALVLWGVFVWLVLGVTLTRLREVAGSWIDDYVANGGGPGVSTETAEAVAGQLRNFMGIAPYLVPGLLGMGAILLAACSLGLAGRIFPRLRQRVAVDLSFAEFRMHWGTAYVFVAGLAMLLLSRIDGRWGEVLLYAGINVLLVSQTLFFLQGLAVVHWLAVHRHMRTGQRVALYIAAGLGQLLFQLTGLFGLFDTWADYRKRFALKIPGAGPAK